MVSFTSSYRLRGVTRDATKPNAKALEALGIEMISGDIANIDDLDKAFTGAQVVFVRLSLMAPSQLRVQLWS